MSTSYSIWTATTTIYVGNYYEATIDATSNVTATKYYYFGKQRVAMQVASNVYYLHADHLGSTSVVVA